MKALIVLVALVSVSVPALAKGKKEGRKPNAACTYTVEELATAMFAAGDKFELMKKEHVSEIRTAPTCKNIEQGVREYTINVDSCGNCMPKRGVLVINQDLRPTYADGAPIYTYDISYPRASGGGGAR